MYFNFIVENALPMGRVILQITTENDTTLSVATPLRIAPEDWDTEKERPKNIYLKIHKRLNHQLDRLRIAIAGYLKEVKQHKAVLSVKTMQGRVGKCLKESKSHYPTDSLLHAMYQYIHSRTHLITTTTYKRYQVFLRLLERFAGHDNKQHHIEEVNAGFVKDFLAFGEKEQYSPSTVTRTLHFVRTILNYLEKRGIRTFAYELEIPKPPTKRKDFVTLSESELAQINKTNVPKELQSVRDWLIISSYTGQRFSDFMQFSSEQIIKVEQKQFITFIQQKTQKYVCLALHPIVQTILKRREGQFPPKISASVYNRKIKEVARLAGINQEIQTRKRRGYRSHDETLPKWQAITSHIGRRSFATNFYGKIPTPLLMEATGHTTEQMFQRYIGNADTSRAAALADHFEHIYRQRVA